MPLRKSALAHGVPLALLLAAPAPMLGATARIEAPPGTPKAVRDAATSIAGLQSGGSEGRTGSAVLVGNRGYVTPTVLVARSTEIILTPEGQQPTVADRQESTAPSGLELLVARERPSGKGLAVRRLDGTPKVWVIRYAGGSKRQIVPARVKSSKRGLVTLSIPHRPGGAGGAVVDAQGRLLAITKPLDSTSGSGTARQQARALPEAPAKTRDRSGDDQASFPAIPVTIILGFLLLIGSFVLRARDRRTLAAPSAPGHAGGPPTPPGAPFAPPGGPPAPGGQQWAPPGSPNPPAPPEDDLEITFRPRR